MSNVASGNGRQRPLDEILSSLRSELARRGARGIVGLQRKFRIIDDNGDGSLSLGEFTKAMIECDLRLSEEVSLSAVFQRGTGKSNFFACRLGNSTTFPSL